VSPWLALALGAVVGSFLNVVAIRLPRGESLVRPGSRCPACGAPIAWFDNIPVLSFVWLRGRCRACRSAISWQYPLVEVATAALFALAAWRAGPRLEVLLPSWALLAALVAVTAIDLAHQVIPDAITLPGIGAGFIASLANPSVGWLDSVLGIVAGGGLIFLVIVVSRGGMGGGDMKLCAMLGAFLGYKLALLAIFSGVLLGGLVAGLLLTTGVKRRKDPIPFGPFLAGGGVIALFMGEEIVRWYLSAFAP
jgi:leader peptidase (prepilin peptidase)/N-methyltransferase